MKMQKGTVGGTGGRILEAMMQSLSVTPKQWTATECFQTGVQSPVPQIPSADHSGESDQENTDAEKSRHVTP